jgi:hypothetical protein
MVNRVITIGINEIIFVFYHSFNHAQGRLVMQPDVLSYVASKWREEKISVDFSMEKELKEKIVSFKIPRGHRIVDENETKAQFGFWWENMWDIFRYQKLDPYNLDFPAPTEEKLQIRSRFHSGNEAYDSNKYESLKADKMGKIAERIAINTPQLGSQKILSKFLIPNLISLESYWQGDWDPPASNPSLLGRKRTDGGDEYECKLLTRCRTALSKVKENIPLTIYDEMYFDISNFLSNLESKVRNQHEEKLYQSYKKLIHLYNKNHIGSEVVSLYL